MFEGLSTQSLVVLLLCAILVRYMYRRSNEVRAGKRYPPGPPRLPFVGSLLHVPKDHEWLAYERMGKQYGSDLIHLDVLGSHIIVVNSAKAANELFEKRSAIYSDRPSFTALTDLIGFDWTLVFCPYGDRFRAFRKGFHTYLSPEAVTQYRPLESKSIHQLLRNLADRPEEFVGHLRHMAGAIILSIGFGIKVEAENDPHVKTAERGLEAISVGSTAQAAMFDFFPVLKNMPSWFPGAGFKEEAKGLRCFSKAMVDGPMQATKDAMAVGKASSSVASAMMTQLETERQTEVEELVARQLPSNMYLGGADTTVCALAYFFLAMTLYPEVQKKAQNEIDSVVGHDRLPDWSDQQSLPYVDALVKEILRWRNITPLGVYHRLTANDIYEDYFLPAGSTVVGNIWAILHDETAFPDPLAFKPERFLDSKVDFPEMVFGFGRRICPGMYLARESVWMAVASVLASFDISKARDENGNEIEPVDDCVEGIVAYPMPFKCNIRPRSEAAHKLIQLTSDELDD